ncbi:DEAD/DEAH box helicase [Ammoniphilus sp. CFH 90114]|uniref:DEAD/DEAH box helicase n=1 Tax=Ammoniphilus sp. CFH 90114 TaxID=2493665 RepID=UPI00100E0696|nr:SNF2-related protein [Ammoniphilus sp. CFH 90114]RXT13649.1 DEAD/DEAH box helicase [Ammoniphilus sp. CFH 90114]
MFKIPVNFNREWITDLKSKLKEDGPWHKWELFQLAYQAEEVTSVANFDELQCLKHLPQLEPFPHQLETAKKVITEMHGRAILADEVGLGKTIEAGLIIKEYMVRSLAKKILILVPASLVVQWARELNQKFGIPAVAQKKEYMWKQYDVVIASIDTAKRDPHRDHVLSQEYDMLIIDEAHKLKNKNTKNYQFIKEIKKKYCLLLTATPIQNDLDELYNLITLLKPGYLGQTTDFQKNYVESKRQARNHEVLQEELKDIMIRNKRSDGGLFFTKRIVEAIPVTLSAEEWELYDGVTRFVKEQYQNSVFKNPLALITLQREVCSSRFAAFDTLVNMHNKLTEDSPARQEILRLAELIRSIKKNAKAEKTLELIQECGDKVIIFTEYRKTQEYLHHYLAENGITSVLFRGGFKRNKKDWMTELFQNRAQVLIATEAGGEGINLQFCNRIINFDLPWNPMRVEQRIGRVHRLGQTRDVFIYNLSTQGTIEEHILHLLYEKINLFEMVIGELDTIVERLKLNQSIENNLVNIFLESDSFREMEIKINNIGEVMKMNKEPSPVSEGLMP